MPEPTPELSTYIQATALLLELPLPPNSQAAVLENLTRIQAIATQVLEFPLSDDIEAAPTFQP